MGTISKALKLLNYFSENGAELGLVEFEKLSGQNKATVHRHLVELEANGFLEQNQKSRKYRLGASILRLAAVREKTFPIRRIIEHQVDLLASQLGELVHASLVQGQVMSSVYFRDYGQGGIRVYFDDAQILPLHASASGLTALAFGDPSLLDETIKTELTKYTDMTTVDPDELVTLVEVARRQGFSEISQGFDEEVHSIAAPFYQEGHNATGSIAIALPVSRLNEDKKPTYVRQLWKTASVVTKELGGAVPPHIQRIWDNSPAQKGE